MKIVLAQQNYHIGNFEENVRKILEAVREAEVLGADLVVCSELSVCGYPPRDFLEFEDFIAQCYSAIDRIRQEADSIGVIVGCPARNPSPEGKPLFNAAWLMYEKEIKGVAHKTCLPTYDVFDEYRYFEPGYEWKVIPFKNKKIALTICEDIWNLGDNPLYRICPMDRLMEQGPDLMINISASPFDYDHDEDRKEVVHHNVLKYKLPMVYVNAVGSQTEIVFDGGSLVYNASGDLIRELKYFEEDLALVEVGAVPPLFEELLPGFSVAVGEPATAAARQPDPLWERGTLIQTRDGSSTAGGSKDKSSAAGSSTNGNPDGRNRTGGTTIADKEPHFDKEMRVSRIADPDKVIEYLVADNNIRQIHAALVLGIRDYFSKMGFTEAILGSSGGIDSAVTLALACEALGKDHVHAILLPSEYSSGHSVKDAEELSRNLGNPYEIISIKEVYGSLLQTLKPIFQQHLSAAKGNTAIGLAEENLQSRTRGNLLMAIANKFGYILLNTSNKSELSTGYGTLYGDMAGGLSVLGDVYKLQVYALAGYINRQGELNGKGAADRKGEIIPGNIISKAPSAELRPGQKDSDSLPEYDILDKVLYQYIEKRQGPREIIAMGIDEALVNRVLRLVNTNEYKRNQFCPIIRVSCKAFGVGRRVPIVGKYLS